MADVRFSIYNGEAPFVFLSYSPADRDLVKEAVRLLDYRGVRFWLSEGVAPGFERDETIAEKILACDYFIAFMSGRYLDDLDETDELNYARDVNKPLTLVYLNDIALPSGIAMRMTRTQNIERWRMDSDEELVDKLLEDPGMKRFYGIADPKIAARAEGLFKKLEEYYPDKNVFALDGMDRQLSKDLPALCAQTEFGSVDDLLRAYGFKKVSAAEAVEKRAGFRYEPGSEPDIIRKKIDSVLASLKSKYPSGRIFESLTAKDPKLARSVIALSQWLGYHSSSEFLGAYGIEYSYSDAVGRKAIDHEKIIGALRERYCAPGAEKPERVSQIIRDLPELSSSLKTISNSAYERFGCTLNDYLTQIGILRKSEKDEVESYGILHERALEALAVRLGLDESGISDLRDKTDGIVLRVNKAGEIYVSRVDECGLTVELPDGLDFIRAEAFADQTDLCEIRFGSGLRTVCEGAFSGCSSLRSVEFPDGFEEVGRRAFSDCVSLTRVSMPPSTRVVREEAFLGCFALSDVKIANKRANIYGGAFDGCPWEVPAGGGSTDPDLFETVPGKKNTVIITGFKGDEEEIYVPDIISGHPVTSVEKGAFAGLTRLKHVHIEDGISSVGTEAFRGCTALESVHLPESLSRFTSTTFGECRNLKEINIPDAMTEIKRGQFRDNPIERLYIGKGLEALAGDAFYKGEVDPVTGAQIRGKAIREVTVAPENAFLSAIGTAVLSADGKTLFAELGDPRSVEVPEGVERIAPHAFAASRLLESVTLPSTLVEIGEHAFEETALTRVEFPPSLRKIGEQAYASCRRLEEAVIPEGLEQIGEQAFAFCPLREIFLPSSLNELGDNAFSLFATYQGETRQTIHIPIGSRVFRTDGSALYGIRDGKRALIKAFDYSFRRPANAPAEGAAEYKVEEGTEFICPYAFARCNNLRSVSFPDSVAEIGDRAFWDCSELEEANGLGDSVTVGVGAFQLTRIEIDK